MKKENTISEAEITAPKLKEIKYETPFGELLETPVVKSKSKK
jgi:hypothetical protein